MGLFDVVGDVVGGVLGVDLPGMDPTKKANVERTPALDEEAKKAFQIANQKAIINAKGKAAVGGINPTAPNAAGQVPVTTVKPVTVTGTAPTYDPTKMDSVALGAAPVASSVSVGAAPTVQGQALGATGYEGMQRDYLGALKAQMQGTGAPSAAQVAIKQQADRALAQQLGVAAGSRAPLAARQALQGQADIAQQANAQIAQAKLQEQEQAQQLFGQVLGQTAGLSAEQQAQQAQLLQQAGLANQSATLQTQLEQGRLQQQTNLANQEASLRTQLEQGQIDFNTYKSNMDAINQQKAQTAGFQQQRDLTQADIDKATALENANMQQRANELGYTTEADRQKFISQQKLQADITKAELMRQYLAMGLSQEQASQQAMMDFYKVQAGINQANVGASNAANTAQQQAKTGLIGGLMSVGGQVAGMAAMASDKRCKKDIRSGEKDVREFLDSLTAHTYRYKDETKKDRPRLGVMAQDVEKSSLGADIVVKSPQGFLALDLNRGFGALMASAADINRRLSKLEKGRTTK
jgi:hypothetical protein